MKNLEQFYTEIMGDEALKEAFLVAYKEGKLGSFLKDNDCNATAEETAEFLKGIKEGAVSDDDLDNVSGGCLTSWSCNATCTCMTCCC